MSALCKRFAANSHRKWAHSRTGTKRSDTIMRSEEYVRYPGKPFKKQFKSLRKLKIQSRPFPSVLMLVVISPRIVTLIFSSSGRRLKLAGRMELLKLSHLQWSSGMSISLQTKNCLYRQKALGVVRDLRKWVEGEMVKLRSLTENVEV